MTEVIAIRDRIAATSERLRQATINLRNDNFKKGFSFMILSENLPDGEAYLEFPDGHIELTGIEELGNNIKLISIRTLSAIEEQLVRKEHGLL